MTIIRQIGQVVRAIPFGPVAFRPRQRPLAGRGTRSCARIATGPKANAHNPWPLVGSPESGVPVASARTHFRTSRSAWPRIHATRRALGMPKHYRASGLWCEARAQESMTRRSSSFSFTREMRPSWKSIQPRWRKSERVRITDSVVVPRRDARVSRVRGKSISDFPS